MTTKQKVENVQSELNIGVIGHVDHGKTTLVSKITNKWASKHSEEIKQGISIKLGYADVSFYKCPKCKGLQAYTNSQVCKYCNSNTEFLKKISFVDSPGHETLMAVMLSGATLLDGGLLVVAVNEDIPQPRTVEHLNALKIHGIKHLVVALNKIDLVSKQKAKEQYLKLRAFLDNEGYNDAPIIPTSAHFDTNIDALIYALLDTIPTPEHDLNAPLKMRIIRSFDINKPGTKIEDLKGGVLGGTVIQGKLSVGDKVWLYPGISKPIEIKIKSLNAEDVSYESVHPGGLIAVGTDIDPFFCVGDKMVGEILCTEESKPFVSQKIDLVYTKIDALVDSNKTPFSVGEKLVVVIGSQAYLGVILKLKGNVLELSLNKSCVYYKNEKVAISRNVNNRWRLSGYGEVK
ncbi:MAG TPA: translation initiation factor IF-2 subunit gamma [archaeon]|nr:translation initiation factor IF-2 subunit gamma [archaeon]HRT02596.1 translation initiation factor IF-2 subunit gamma [Candidatus Diapherotrites archaeon]